MIPKNWTKGLIFVSLMSAPLFLNAVQVAHLSPIPLNMANSTCRGRVFLRGIDALHNTAFLVPYVQNSRGPDPRKTPSADLSSATDAKHDFQLNVYLYFPAKDYAPNGATNPCPAEAAMASLNGGVNSPEDKITQISNLPLSGIDVVIPGIQEIAHIGNSPDGTKIDILNYEGQTLVARFNITKAERETFVSNASYPNKVQAMVTLQFEAGSPDGSVHARINAKDLAAQLLADLKGHAPMIAKGELQAELRKLMRTTEIQIDVEQGTKEEAMDHIATTMIETALKDTPAISLPDKKVDAGGEGQIEIAAVANIIMSQFSKDISYNNYSKPRTSTNLVPMDVMVYTLYEPGTREVWVQAGSQSDLASGIWVKQDTTIRIFPKYDYVEDITYTVRSSPLSVGDLKQLNLFEKFTDLRSMRVADQTLTQGAQATGRTPLNTYTWEREEQVAQRVCSKPRPIAGGVKGIQSLPVTVSFSLYPDVQFTFSDLMEDTDYWTFVKYDKMKGLILKAKQDLGVLRFHESMSDDEQANADSYATLDKSLEMDKFVELRANNFTGQKQEADSYIRVMEKPVTKQKTIVFLVGITSGG